MKRLFCIMVLLLGTISAARAEDHLLHAVRSGTNWYAGCFWTNQFRNAVFASAELTALSNALAITSTTGRKDAIRVVMNDAIGNVAGTESLGRVENAATIDEYKIAFTDDPVALLVEWNVVETE